MMAPTLERQLEEQSGANLALLAGNEAILRKTRLAEMAAKAEAAWPGIRYADGGSRAQAAAELVLAELVTRRTPLANGHDHWVVNGHHVSFAGNHCDCHDMAAPEDARTGRLCKHRLAVMMQMRLDAAQGDLLEQVFRSASQRLALEVRVTYAGDVRAQVNRLAGWRADDGTWVRLERREEEIAFSHEELQAILARLGWRVLPAARVNLERHAGGRERWFLERAERADGRADGFQPGPRADRLYGWDAGKASEVRRDAAVGMMFAEAVTEAAVAAGE